MSSFSNDEHGLTELRLSRAKAAYLANRRRERVFGPITRSDQRWDILLVLYILDATDEYPSLTRLTKLSAGSMTTAMRALDRFAASGLITRLRHPRDRRGVLLKLTVKAREMLDRYFDEPVEIEAIHRVF